MPDSTRIDQFRLALSYLERIQGETAHWDKLRADRQLDRTKYDAVRARYADHLTRATELVENMRRDAARDIPAAESQLAGVQEQQKKLVRQASAGKADPRAINEKGRTLAAKRSSLQAQLDSLKLIATAQSTAELGGGVDLPLEEYPQRLDLLPKPAPIARKELTPLQSNLIWGVVMLALVLSAVGAIYLWRAAPHPAFSISEDDAAARFITVECRNEGNGTLYLYVPWPNGSASPLPGVSRSGNSWGVNLSIRERGQDQFRLYEDAGALWKTRGSYMENQGPLAVNGGAVTRLALDLDKLHATDLNPEAVLIECTKAGGAVVLRREIRIPPPR